MRYAISTHVCMTCPSSMMNNNSSGVHCLCMLGDLSAYADTLPGLCNCNITMLHGRPVYVQCKQR